MPDPSKEIDTVSNHPEIEDLMTEALFDEISPENRRRLEAHFEACEDCRDEFERLQATLGVMTEREREELPAAYWASFRKQVLDRVDRSPSLGERLAEWWRSLPVLLPQTSGQWAVQALAAVLFVALGLWMAEPSPIPTGSTGSGALATLNESPPLQDVLLGQASASLKGGRIQPRLRSIRDIAYNPDARQVEVRYSTVNEVTVTGAPDDPAIRPLLQAALLDRNSPAAQLNAVQTLERSALRPTDDLVRALTVLIRTEDNVPLQLRAIRALRRMHGDTALDTPTRNLLVGLVLDDNPDALRVEALQTLMAAPDSSSDPSFLYAVQDDPNDYLRYKAQSTLQTAAQVRPAQVETP